MTRTADGRTRPLALVVGRLTAYIFIAEAEGARSC
jgi:hypothetical protein